MEYLQYILTLPMHIFLFIVTIKYMDKIYEKLNIKKSLLYTIAAIFILLTYGIKQIQSTNVNIDLGQGVIFAVLLSIFYTANVRTKILYSILAVVLAIFSQTIILYLAILILQEDLNVIVSLNPQYFIVTMCMYSLYYLLCVFVTKFQKSKKNAYPPKILIMLLSIPTISFIGVILLYSDILNYKYFDNFRIIFCIVILFLIIYINFTVFYLFDLLLGLFNEKIDKKFLNMQIALQNKYYKKLESNQEVIKAMRHDMKNRLKTIHYNIVNNNFDVANSIIENIVENITNTEKIIESGNPSIDTVLNIKMDESYKKGIQINPDIIIPQNLNFSFEDSVVLFGNILDNAIEACEKLYYREKIINLKIRYINRALYIESSNYIENNLILNENNFLTSKKDKNNHGFGLKNVKLMADKYNGMVKIMAENDLFCIKIVLYNL